MAHHAREIVRSSEITQTLLAHTRFTDESPAPRAVHPSRGLGPDLHIPEYRSNVADDLQTNERLDHLEPSGQGAFEYFILQISYIPKRLCRIVTVDPFEEIYYSIRVEKGAMASRLLRWVTIFVTINPIAVTLFRYSQHLTACRE
jgi:hypothetical protein